jgi:hypothetical protein
VNQVALNGGAETEQDPDVLRHRRRGRTRGSGSTVGCGWLRHGCLRGSEGGGLLASCGGGALTFSYTKKVDRVYSKRGEQRRKWWEDKFEASRWGGRKAERGSKAEMAPVVHGQKGSSLIISIRTL